MIKINLADRKRADIGGGAGTSTLTLRKIDLSALKEFPLQKILVPLAIAIAATYGVSLYEDNEMQKLNAELESINSEKPKLQAAASKMKIYEDLRAGMDADEFVIRTKLDTIRKLIENRGQISKSMQELAKITPASVWLTSFSYDGTAFDVQGGAWNFRQISPFLKALNENPMFQDLTLKDSQTALDINRREIVTFDLASGVKK